MKKFLSLILFISFTVAVFGQQISKKQMDSIPVISVVKYGTRELVLSPDGHFFHRWTNKSDTLNIQDDGLWARIDTITINGTKVRILNYGNGSGVAPMNFSDTIYSSDTNKIKPIKVIYLKK